MLQAGNCTAHKLLPDQLAEPSAPISSNGHPEGALPNFFLKGVREMGETFEAQVEINCSRFFLLFFYQVPGFLEPLFQQPLPGRHAEELLKSRLNPARLLPVSLANFSTGTL